MIKPYRKKPVQFIIRLAQLYWTRPDATGQLVEKSYDRISNGYDQAWTDHMRDHTDDMLNCLAIRPGMSIIDLACGTGYATSQAARLAGKPAVGVDRSAGMIACARRNYPEAGEFVQGDILDYLAALPGQSVDGVTCCWGLGYSKPLAVLRQIRRVLKKGGKVGIIDNSIFSLREVIDASMLTFLEFPERLENLMRFHFLAGPAHLGWWFRLAGLKPLDLWGGERPFPVLCGRQAVEQMKQTGAAAGFEYAASRQYEQEIMDRFAVIYEKQWRSSASLAIVHRYLGGIAIK